MRTTAALYVAVLAASVSAVTLPASVVSVSKSSASAGDAHQQQHRGATQSAAATPGQYGKFLHITDLHPDAHYTQGSPVEKACHISRKQEKKHHGGRFPPIAGLLHATAQSLKSRLRPGIEAKKERAGHWGAPNSICDSPPTLITDSLRWITDNWLPEPGSTKADDGRGFDFILVTGDLARHDVDAQSYPRTLPEIYNSNRWIMEQLERAFPGIPLVPCVGNNDIFPHNIMFPGPSPVTRQLANIWSAHIPEFEVHNFQRGAYFAKEVIPNELAVLSLNTIYMYDSNKVVDGCVKSKRGKPEKDRDAGTVMLDWMEVQLSLFRSRGMQVHIMGHVPPTAGNYFPLCYERYTDIVLRYQDTVVGQHFGHMNVDSFFVQEDEEAVILPVQGSDFRRNDSVSWLPQGGRLGTSSLADDLQDDYATLPGRKRTNLDYYHTFFAAPSIVPTFLPTVRVFSYNNTRSAKRGLSLSAQTEHTVHFPEGDEDEDDEDDKDEDESPVLTIRSRSHRRRHRKHKKRKHRKKKLPRYASPDSPARTNTYLSMLGYSQWVLDLDRANAEWEKRHSSGLDSRLWGDYGAGRERRSGGKKEGAKLEYELEYVTYEPETLWAPYLAADEKARRVEQDQQEAELPVAVPKALLDRQLDRLGVSAPHYLSSADSEQGTGRSGSTLHRLRCDLLRALTWRWAPDSTSFCAIQPQPQTQTRDADEEDMTIASRLHASRKLRLPKEVKHLTDYSMPSLTVEPMMELARRLASDKKLWKRFTGRMYQGSVGS
ncbi:hypothetical protein V8E36_003586 [Tilletia maclaganii]